MQAPQIDAPVRCLRIIRDPVDQFGDNHHVRFTLPWRGRVARTTRGGGGVWASPPPPRAHTARGGVILLTPTRLASYDAHRPPPPGGGGENAAPSTRTDQPDFVLPAQQGGPEAVAAQCRAHQ